MKTSLVKLKEMTFAKCLEQYLAHGRCYRVEREKEK